MFMWKMAVKMERERERLQGPLRTKDHAGVNVSGLPVTSFITRHYEVMFSSALVSQFLCYQDYAKPLNQFS